VASNGLETRRVPLWRIGLGTLALAGVGFASTALAISPGASALPTAVVMPGTKSQPAPVPVIAPVAATTDPAGSAQIGVVPPARPVITETFQGTQTTTPPSGGWNSNQQAESSSTTTTAPSSWPSRTRWGGGGQDQKTPSYGAGE
jgi:hypothetical protein